MKQTYFSFLFKKNKRIFKIPTVLFCVTNTNFILKKFKKDV